MSLVHRSASLPLVLSCQFSASIISASAKAHARRCTLLLSAAMLYTFNMSQLLLIYFCISSLFHMRFENLGETRSGMGKNGAQEHKSDNISETRKDRGNVITDGL